MFAAWATWLIVAAAAPPLPFERYVAPFPLSDEVRGLAYEVRRWGQHRGAPLQFDWRLARAASKLCPTLGSQVALPAQATLEEASLHEGVTDAELTAIALGGAAAAHPALLRQQLLLEPAELMPTHFGVASCDSPHHAGDRRTVVLLSRRLVQLAPTASWRAPHSPLHLLGQLAVPHVHKVSLALVRSDGTLQRPTPLAVQGGAFVTQVALGERVGTARVQLLVERGQGPEVAAEFPVEVGHPAHKTTPSGGLRAHHATSTSADLVALIFGLRHSRGLALPEPHTGLIEVAQKHCEDMLKGHYFAHISRSSGSVVERLQHAHIAFLHVVENLAEARDVEDMFSGWVASPSHLANLLDPQVDCFGLYVCGEPRGISPKKAVLIMAKLTARGHREASLPDRTKSDVPPVPARP